MDNTAPLKPGDPIRAETLNAAINGAKLARLLQKDGGEPLAGFNTSNTAIRVLNDTGLDLPRFSVLKISEPIFMPEDNAGIFFKGPAFRGETPDGDTEHFAVLQLPARAGQIVPACVSGATIVRLQASSSLTTANPNDQRNMTATEEGKASIIWQNTETEEDGTVWAVIILCGSGGGTVINQVNDLTVEIVHPVTAHLTTAFGNIPKNVTINVEGETATFKNMLWDSYWKIGKGKVSGKTYSPILSRTEVFDIKDNAGNVIGTETKKWYKKAIQVKYWKSPSGVKHAVRTMGFALLPDNTIIYEYIDGGEFKPWEPDFVWQETEYPEFAEKNWDDVICPDLYYPNETLVPGMTLKAEMITVPVIETKMTSDGDGIVPETWDNGCHKLIINQKSICKAIAPEFYTSGLMGKSETVHYEMLTYRMPAGFYRKDDSAAEFSLEAGQHPASEGWIPMSDFVCSQFIAREPDDPNANENSARCIYPKYDNPYKGIANAVNMTPMMENVSAIHNNGCERFLQSLFPKSDTNQVMFFNSVSCDTIPYKTALEVMYPYCYGNIDTDNRVPNNINPLFNIVRSMIQGFKALYVPQYYCTTPREWAITAE